MSAKKCHIATIIRTRDVEKQRKNNREFMRRDVENNKVSSAMAGTSIKNNKKYCCNHER